MEETINILFDTQDEDVWFTLPEKLMDTPVPTASAPSDPSVIVAKQKPGRRWTLREDEKLVKLMQKYGMEWAKIATFFDGKNAKQIKERWKNQLDPCVLDVPFSVEDDLELLQHIRTYGRSWSKISRIMPRRSELMLKNRYHSFLSRRLEPNHFSCLCPLPPRSELIYRLTVPTRRGSARKQDEEFIEVYTAKHDTLVTIISTCCF